MTEPIMKKPEGQSVKVPPETLDLIKDEQYRRRKATHVEPNIADLITEAVRLLVHAPPEISHTQSQPCEKRPPVIDLSDAPPHSQRWIKALGYILKHGDRDTIEAITRNLERFELLTELLSGDVSHVHGVTVSEAPTRRPSPDLEQLREIDAGAGGGRTDPQAPPGQSESAEGANPKTPPRRKRKS